MEEGQKKQANTEEGRLQDLLHNKEQKLPSLRTYQGDVAEFIKEKDQSVAKVIVKEKERKEEREKLEPADQKAKKSSQPINLTMLALSLVLVLGGAAALLYIFNFFQNQVPMETKPETDVFPYNNIVTLANVTPENLWSEVGESSLNNGVNLVKISGPDGLLIKEVAEFMRFLDLIPPPALSRTLGDDYMVGVLSKENNSSPFLVFKINDFGIAFEAMLEWEETMREDFSSFLSRGAENGEADQRQNEWLWTDVIVKNKDTRALQNNFGKTLLAYTFLDKNTILIVSDLEAIGGLSSLYASRAFAR